MKCSLCGTELQPGNNICPSCGALNMGFEQQAPAAPTSTPVQSAPAPTPTSGPQIIDDTPAQAVPQQQPLEVAPQAQEQPVQEQPVNENATDLDNDGVIEEFEDLDSGEAEVVNATADMEAPSLEVEQEHLADGAMDISSSQNVATYNPDEVVEETTEEQSGPKEVGPDFQIPEVQEPDKVELNENGIQEVKTTGKTVGEIQEVKEKFSLKIFKKKTLPRNLVIILVVSALVIGLLLGATLFAKQTYTPKSASSKKQNVTIAHVSDGKNNTTYAGKYKFQIPDKYEYDKSNDGLVVYAKDDSFKIFIKAVDGSYEHVINSKDSIKRSLMASDNSGVNNIKEEKINNTNYLIIEFTNITRNRLLAIRQGPNDNLFYIESTTNDDNYNYSTIDIADDIINNAEYTDSLSTMEKIVIEDYGAMISAVAEAANAPTGR